MTILALGTWMMITVAAQKDWKSRRILRPLLMLGQLSYEVYLTHIFVVLGIFSLFLLTGKQMKSVPALFIAVILVSGFLGEIVARFYAEPMNRRLRARWRKGAGKLGSVIGPSERAEKLDPRLS
jgi:peptidoglycan/LPS O-acetylase OafA/YrhL